MPFSPSSRLARRLAPRFALIAMLAAALPLASCGGGGAEEPAGTASGRATLSITWPAPTSTRLIPVASNSIKLTFLNGGVTSSTQTVARPTSGNTSTVTFSNLPATTLTLNATAYPNANGTGTAQASASQSVTITAGNTARVSITMASTISTLSVAPATISVLSGGTATVTATALNAEGTTVLTSGTTTYTSSNPSVATVSTAGLVTGVAAGTATITARETESGKTGTSTVAVGGIVEANVVDLANAYLATLTSAQRTATLLAATGANAANWSNLPATPIGTTGTSDQRNGVSFSTLTAAQKTAWTNLVNAALAGQPLTQFNAIRRSDDFLGGLRTGYSGDYEYVAFVGTPSAASGWLLQIGGHHIANNLYYTGSTPSATTPYFLGVEPQSFTSGGTAYTPLAAQRNAMFALVNGLSTGQLTTAKLSTNFSDVYLGPDRDARGNFPTGTSGRGVLANTLTTATKNLLKTAIAAWTQNSPLASTYQSLYESELDQTYVAYSGTTTFNNQGDYVRIDGPHVWIEFVCQNGVVTSGIHFHTVWRDRVTDYNAAYGF